MLKFLKKILFHQQFQKLSIYGFGQLFNLVTPLLVVPYIVSVCGVENFGKVSIAMAVSFFMMVFIDYGFDIIGVKEAAVNREKEIELEKIFITIFCSKAVLLVLVLTLSTLLFYFVPFFNKDKSLYFLGLPILIGQCINPTWFLQGVENFKWITILTIVSKLIYLFCIFFFIHQKEDYIFINFWWGIGTILANGLAFYYIFRKHNFSFSKLKKEHILDLLKGNFSLFSSQIFVSLQMYAPIVFLGFLGTNLLAGHYKIVEQIIVVFKTYIYLFFNFVYSRVCYLLEKNREEGIRFWKIYNGLNFLFILVSMLIVFLFASQVVNFFTEIDVLQISNFLRLAVLIPLALSISIPLKQLLLGFDKQKIYVRITMIMVVTNLLGMIILIPSFKINGVLLSLILTEVATICIYYYNLKKNLKNELF